MLNLIKNEYIKVFKKKSTYAWLIIGVLITIFFYIMFHNMLHSHYNYRDDWGPYMSETYVENSIADIENYKGTSFSSTLAYYYKIKELGLYEVAQWRYNALDMAYQTYYYEANNPDSSEGLTTERKNELTTLVTDIVSAVKNDDYTGYYKIMAKAEETRTYTFTGNEDAITNQYQYRLDHKINPEQEAWKDELITTLVTLQDSMESLSSYSSGDTQELSENYKLFKISKYRLNHDINIALTEEIDSDYSYMINKGDYWNALDNSSNLVLFISILIIIIAGGCIASEFSTGTIKFLLINPVKRSKIIISKYLMILTLTFGLILVYYGVNIVIGMCFFGIDEVSAPFLSVVNGNIHATSSFGYVLSLYLYRGVEVLCYGTMAFAISSLLRSSSVAIGASVALLISGSLITNLLVVFNQDWGRYLLFSNTDILTIRKGASLFPHQTLGFAVVTLVVYMVVFLWIAYDGFVRREV